MDLNKMLDSVYGPLPKSYCLYFKILAIFAFVMLAISLIALVMHFLTGKSFLTVGKSPVTIGLTFALVVGYFVEYLTSRLLNTMCIKSLDA